MGQPDQAEDEVARIQAIQDNAKRLGLIWQRTIGTVVGEDPITVLVDADSEPIGMKSMVGQVYQGQRVYVDQVPPSANFISGVAEDPVQLGGRWQITNAQAIADITQVTLSFNVNNEQSNGIFGSAVPITVFRIPTPGLWAVTAQIFLANNATGRSFLAINATTTVLGAPTIYRTSWGAGERVAALGVTVPFNSGDSFSAAVFQTTGVPTTVTSGWLGLYRVGGWTPVPPV